MSFLSQCIWYFLKAAIGFFANGELLWGISDNARLVLAGVSLVMTVAGFVYIFKTASKPVRYLDIPLIFLVSALEIVFEIYVSQFSAFSLVPGILGLIPGAFYTVRCFRWFIDVVHKKRKPEKKNVIVLAGYIIASLVFISFMFIDFGADKQKPTQNEIQLVNECYDYTQMYLSSLPTDKSELRKIDDVTEKITEASVFKRAYDKSEFYKNSDGGIFRGATKLKQMTRQRAYADVVALRLKTLIALKQYDAYYDLFINNCGYLFYADNSYYLELWVNDTYDLSDEDFDAIISGYLGALELCDYDSDRLFITGDIVDFYEEYEPDNADIEKYRELRSQIYDANDFEDLLETVRENPGYASEKLAIE